MIYLIQFRLNRYHFTISNVESKHERAGTKEFPTGTVTVKRLTKRISVQWETRTSEQQVNFDSAIASFDSE